jgi:hypothetical protein
MRNGPTTFVLASVLALAACAANDSVASPPEPESAGSWQEFPGSPLSPREAALGLWTGTEVLILGGSDEPCPPNADCVEDPTPLTDGAALNPDTGQWRRIADAPVPLTGAQGVVVGQTGFVLRAGAEELLTYSVADDRWGTLPVPFDTSGWYALAAAGDRLVAYLASDEADRGDDHLYDPATGQWRTLPADPLGDAFDRTAVWTGQELLLFDKELVPNPGAERPSIARAAGYDPAADEWRRLPDSGILSTSPWVLTAGGDLVNPNLGGADGGETNNWGRTYPDGGRFSPATGEWSPLPDPPAGAEPEHSAGAFTATTAVYTTDSGFVLDVEADRWLTLPSSPDGEVAGRLVVAAGNALVAFGGTDWSTTGGTLLDTSWIWSPPS